MKKSFTHILIALSFISLSFAACNKGGEDHNDKNHNEVTDESGEALPLDSSSAAAPDTSSIAHVHYACPMACDNNRMYTEDVPCDVCGMKLKKVEHEGH